MDNDAPTTKVKMSGYLHLKVKKRMMSSWKSYWFVLEDRLLLYYRSKTEYDAISPCKGSISLGPPCAVKSLPSVQNGFQLETRTVTYTLKAENSDEQKRWMQTILSALNQNQNFQPEGPKRLSHFRYSLDDLIPQVEPNDNRVLQDPTLQRQNTLPHRLKTPTKDNELIQRLQKIGAHSYGGSLEAITKIVTMKAQSPTLSGNPSRSSQGSGTEDNFVRFKRPGGDNIYERISGDSECSDRVSFLVDNENYSVPVRKSVSAVEGDKNMVVPRETKSLIVENDQYGVGRQVQSEEAIYSEPKIFEKIDCNKNSVSVENTFYACTDVVKKTLQPKENIYEDLDKFRPILEGKSSSQSSVEYSKPSNQKPDQKVKITKSKSFIKRVWKRKKTKTDKEEKPEEEQIYAEVDPVAVEKVSVTDDSAIQMLSELHNILEKHKTKMKTTTSSPDKIAPTSTSADSVCPSLPPKTHKPTQDTVSNLPIEQVRSLDEILEDLDKEKVESKSKVQMLIEKFSEPEDVILRKHDKSDVNQYRHSDDLNLLLDELAKVTCAPILTPGVTSSLLNPNLTNEEWLKLLPVRQRRLSEPDYDIPRPHKSIQLPVTPPVDVIPATRFFGPVLPSTDNKEESLPISMTPDSLEVDQQPKYDTHYSYTSHHYNNQTDFRVFPQDYHHDEKIIYAMPKSYVSVATHIVNTCQNICGAPATEENTIVYKSVKNVEVQEEIFKDSLDLCSEKSTEF